MHSVSNKNPLFKIQVEIGRISAESFSVETFTHEGDLSASDPSINFSCGASFSQRKPQRRKSRSHKATLFALHTHSHMPALFARCARSKNNKSAAAFLRSTRTERRDTYRVRSRCYTEQLDFAFGPAVSFKIIRFIYLQCMILK